MDTNNRIDKIRAYVKERDQKKMSEAKVIETQAESLQKKLRALAPRISELIRIGYELIRNDIPLGKWTGYTDNSGELVSNTISHRVGFIPFKGILSIGQMGGGACGKHLILDNDGNLWSGGFSANACVMHTSDDQFIVKATEFLDKFDEFERKTFEYVDNLGCNQ